ncbi:major facilitator superfamily transporter [Colletotrichum truncatum]|uniref:Major facilitator superfamily transporter n=1 Tax=Colletotrichum truncatum TaxID=5467 RepID=A0ACC3ZG73_COLTU|nr:major facilitator superfamily transporter [Colletotrichum truncatum]KAF6802014.1 major facilitator superfamily transporter [Colletotrichum truncatum]
MRRPWSFAVARPDKRPPASKSSEQTPLLQDYQSTTVSKESHASSWASLPNKGRLAVIVFARLAEPLSERSLTSYLFFQLQWFNPDLDPSEIPKQAGYLTAVFAAAQCITSIWWGHAADNPQLGRKRVLLIGLTGSAMSALGMGFSRSLAAAFFFRFCAGALNGNVGVLRTMVSEIVVNKRHQSRAFLLLPMCFNVGVIIGPLLSGFLADPVHTLPGTFGPGTFFGGADGVRWLQTFPFAPPNLLCAVILATAALSIIVGLDETHPQLRHKSDIGRKFGKHMTQKVLKLWSPDHQYDQLPSQAPAVPIGPFLDEEAEATPIILKERTRVPFRKVFTRAVCLNMLQRFLQSLHVSAFNSILFSLLPTPRADNNSAHLPFRFSGGLGLSSKKIGLANTTIGMIGLPLQLLVYPRLINIFGVRGSYRVFLPLSIAAYFALPYLVLLPSDVGLGFVGGSDDACISQDICQPGDYDARQ